MKEWQINLSSSIINSWHTYEGNFEKDRISEIKKFWKESRICEDDFAKIADTGDILLFKSHNLGSKL